MKQERADLERRLTTTLSHNRTENIGQDVWNQFVIPRYYDKHDFLGTMPCVIQGGRGCGKTMLLRFLSYQTQFSNNRNIDFNENEELLDHIGIYLRAETSFLRLLQKRGIDNSIWKQAFVHYLVILISIEITEAVLLAASKLSRSSLHDVFLEEMSDYGNTFSSSLDEYPRIFRRLKRNFELAVSNPNLLEEQTFFPASFVNDYIQMLKGSVNFIESTIFHVFVDEYENLLDYQQVFINTRIKHSEPPIIYKIACKRNGMPLKETDGDESIQEKDDYIVHDIDDYTLKSGYSVFAGEVLKHRLSAEHLSKNVLSLNDISTLDSRRENSYIESVEQEKRALFPGKSQNELAEDVFNIQSLKSKLADLLSGSYHLKNSKEYKASDFLSEEKKEASIVCTALLNRKSINVNQLKSEFDEFVGGGKESPFVNWISNNFVGCYLNIILRRKQENRLYCGYDTFIQLSKGNLRHFLELARTAFSFGYRFEDESLVVPQENQALAAEKTASALFNEIRSFKPYGQKIQIFANRLGNIFSVYQNRLSQSEPEISHFSIDGGDTELSESARDLIYECEKWGVLYRTSATKTKSRNTIDDFDWVLNPIYAPTFHISYRKKRKIVITAGDIGRFFDDDGEHFERYLHSLKTKIDNQVALLETSQHQQSLL